MDKTTPPQTVDEANKILDQLYSDIDQAKAELASLLDTQNSTKLEIEKLDQDIEIVTQQQTDAVKELGSISALIDKGNQEVAKMKKTIDSLNEAKTTVQGQIDTLQAQVDQLAIDYQTRSDASAKKYNDLIVSYTNQISGFRDQVSALTQDIADKTDDLAKLSEEAIASQNKVKELNATVVALQGQIVDLNASVENADKQSQEYNAAIETAEVKLIAVNGDISTAKNVLDGLNGDIVKANKDVADAGIELDSLKKQIGQLNQRALAVAAREAVASQRYAYIKGLYDSAGIQMPADPTDPQDPSNVPQP